MADCRHVVFKVRPRSRHAASSSPCRAIIHPDRRCSATLLEPGGTFGAKTPETTFETEPVPPDNPKLVVSSFMKEQVSFFRRKGGSEAKLAKLAQLMQTDITSYMAPSSSLYWGEGRHVWMDKQHRSWRRWICD